MSSRVTTTYRPGIGRAVLASALGSAAVTGFVVLAAHRWPFCLLLPCYGVVVGVAWRIFRSTRFWLVDDFLIAHRRSRTAVVPLRDVTAVSVEWLPSGRPVLNLTAGRGQRVEVSVTSSSADFRRQLGQALVRESPSMAMTSRARRAVGL